MKGWRCTAFVLALCVPVSGRADDVTPPTPIYQQEPYDQITVNAANGGGTFKVMPLDLPERQVPSAPKPDDVLTVRMLDHGETAAQISWKHIAKLELFEQLVLAEAQRLSAAQDFEAAYDHFAFLQQNYPRLAGLADATRDFRYRNAGVFFRQGRHAEALMLLEAVYREEPQRSGLPAALANVSQPLFETYRKAGRFDAARALVSRTKERNDEASLALVKTWQTQLASDARAKEQIARQQFAAGNFREASAAAQEMLAIDPGLPSGAAIASEIAERWPVVRVGVGQLAPTLGGKIPLERTAARISMIATRPLTTLSRFGPDGPVYESSLGSVTTAANRRSVSMESKSLTGYDIGQRLLTIGDAQNSAGDPLWASLLRTVSVRDVYHVNVELQRAHPQPLAVLAHASMGERYVGESSTKQRTVHIDTNARGPREIVEFAAPSTAVALADLRHGQLDVVERIAPSEVAALADDASLRVGRYAVPSVHVLIPNYRRSYPTSSTFRRAIAYGLPREKILHEELLGRVAIEGCRTISGATPMGNAREGWAYGYDRAVAPLAYEPRLALTLLRVADDEKVRIAQRQNAKFAQRGAIVIGHGSDVLHRRACEAMAEQLTRIGIACKHIDVSQAGATAAADCDFWYVELSMQEPLVDIVRLFGRGGVIEPSAYLELAVADVMNATNAAQAEDRLRALHTIAHTEQAVIPLWQLVDHYAVRADFEGLEQNAVSLYGNIDNWKLVAKPIATENRP